MVIGAIAVVFFAKDFIGPFQGFLITLGVPIAAWAGIFLADILLRTQGLRRRRAVHARSGRYGSVELAGDRAHRGRHRRSGGASSSRPPASRGSPGRATCSARPKGDFYGDWAYANLGVLFALVIGFVGTLIGGRGRIRRQENH